MALQAFRTHAKSKSASRHPWSAWSAPRASEAMSKPRFCAQRPLRGPPVQSRRFPRPGRTWRTTTTTTTIWRPSMPEGQGGVRDGSRTHWLAGTIAARVGRATAEARRLNGSTASRWIAEMSVKTSVTDRSRQHVQPNTLHHPRSRDTRSKAAARAKSPPTTCPRSLSNIHTLPCASAACEL